MFTGYKLSISVVIAYQTGIYNCSINDAMYKYDLFNLVQ